MEIRSYLKDNILLFDGGMGTLCAELIPEQADRPCESLNLTHPEQIREIHRAYLKAGCRAIKTNTFGANPVAMDEENCREILKAGWDLANEFGDRAFIFADIGPISVTDVGDLGREYRFVIDEFLAYGASCFLFETNSTFDGLGEAARYIKTRKPEAFVIVSFSSLPDGFTRTGQTVFELLKQADGVEEIDAVGLNCASGARHTAELVAKLPELKKLLSVMPNAGYPTVLGNRTFYDGDSAYFGHQIGAMAAHGVKIVGGCCGTTPQHIAAAARELQNPSVGIPVLAYHRPEKVERENRFWNELCDPNRRPFAVELDPPESAVVDKYMRGAKTLAESGASVITIADCPIARARMDSSLLACKLHRELGIDVIPHMTCRDRNLNAIKALLLGLCAEGVHNVLVVTGDPIPTADRSEVKSVYNFNSRMLARYVTTLGENSLPIPFHVFAALNVNALNFHIQLRIAQQKEESGVCGFLTQPVLTPQAFENLKLARATLKGKILGGIFPLVGHRNACFMNSEVAGVKVDEKVISMYENTTKEEAEQLGEDISVEIARRMRPYVDGYYLMTPFARTELMGRIMKRIRENDSSADT